MLQQEELGGVIPACMVNLGHVACGSQPKNAQKIRQFAGDNRNGRNKHGEKRRKP
jgi:hypothetical protein